MGLIFKKYRFMNLKKCFTFFNRTNVGIEIYSMYLLSLRTKLSSSFRDPKLLFSEEATINYANQSFFYKISMTFFSKHEMAINFFVRKQKFSHVRQAFVFKISGKKISRQFPFSCVKSTKSSAARRNPPKRRSRRLT